MLEKLSETPQPQLTYTVPTAHIPQCHLVMILEHLQGCGASQLLGSLMQCLIQPRPWDAGVMWAGEFLNLGITKLWLAMPRGALKNVKVGAGVAESNLIHFRTGDKCTLKCSEFFSIVIYRSGDKSMVWRKWTTHLLKTRVRTRWLLPTKSKWLAARCVPFFERCVAHW